MTAAWVPVTGLVVAVIALIAGIVALLRLTSIETVRSEMKVEFDRRSRKDAGAFDEIRLIGNRLNAVEAKQAWLTSAFEAQVKSMNKASNTPAPNVSSPVLPNYLRVPQAPAVNHGATQISRVMEAIRSLIENLNYQSRDRLVAEFGLRNLDANLAETAGDGLYWLLPLDGGQDAIFPGWPVIKDWHMVYRGADKVVARQVLQRCFDIGDGAGLRVVAPARVASANPAEVAERGRLEGA